MTELVVIPHSVSFAAISSTRGEIIPFPRQIKGEGRGILAVNLPPCGRDVPEGHRGVARAALEMQIGDAAHVH